MCGSGVKIGMANTAVLLRSILMVLPVSLAAWTVEVAGATLPGAVARLAVTTARLTTVTTASGSA